MANLKTAWKAFWAIFSDDSKAEAWQNLDAKAPAAVEKAPQPVPGAQPADALLLLSILQREARFVDFIQEDLAGYDDAAVGGVSRKVHDDCRRCLDRYFAIAPVMAEAEQARVQVPEGFDPRSIKVTGRVSGGAPYSGIVQHRGWKAAKQELPARTASQDGCLVISPAEVEI